MSTFPGASRIGSSRRERISSVAARFGITRVLEAVARVPSLIVLNYHRIGDPEADDYDPALLEATADAFDAQLALLRKRYHVCEVAEALELIARPNSIRRPSFLLTFDDGYRDNHDVALPILRSNGIQAVFFLATGYVGTLRMPWWDQIAYLCRRSERRTITVEYPEKRTFVLNRVSIQRVVREVLRMYKTAASRDAARFMAQLETACGVACPEESAERLFMTWGEARNLVAAGMGIGSHTHNHEILAKQTAAEQLAECTMSKAVLKTELGIDVSMLSYPVGGANSFDDVTLDCVRRAGYSAAFTYGSGVNLPSQLKPLEVARMAVDPCSLDHYRTRVGVAALARRQFW